MKLTGAAIVARALADEGIRHTFGIPGTHNIELYDALAQSPVRPVLVTDEQDRLVGILTDRDLRHSAFLPLLARHLAWEERWLLAPRVRDIMTRSVVTIDPDADLTRAGLLMFERRIGSLPVTDHGRLVGIVTEHDLIDVSAKLLERFLAD